MNLFSTSVTILSALFVYQSTVSADVLGHRNLTCKTTINGVAKQMNVFIKPTELGVQLNIPKAFAMVSVVPGTNQISISLPASREVSVVAKGSLVNGESVTLETCHQVLNSCEDQRFLWNN